MASNSKRIRPSSMSPGATAGAAGNDSSAPASPVLLVGATGKHSSIATDNMMNGCSNGVAVMVAATAAAAAEAPFANSRDADTNRTSTTSHDDDDEEEEDDDQRLQPEPQQQPPKTGRTKQEQARGPSVVVDAAAVPVSPPLPPPSLGGGDSSPPTPRSEDSKRRNYHLQSSSPRGSPNSQNNNSNQSSPTTACRANPPPPTFGQQSSDPRSGSGTGSGSGTSPPDMPMESASNPEKHLAVARYSNEGDRDHDDDDSDDDDSDSDDPKKTGRNKHLVPGRRDGDGGGGTDGDDDDLHLYTSRVPTTDRVVEWIQTFRYYCGRIVNQEQVQFFLVALIGINAIMMGIGTFDFVTENPPVEAAFEIVDKAFLIVFTIELAMQFVYLGWRILLDGWLVFDLVIILTSWVFAEVQIIRAFRIFRALRLITRIKVMKNLVLALFGVMPRMFAIGVLLFLISYIFAVMFTQLFKDMYELEQTDEDYFGRLDETFFTLFQIMTLDAWADIARQVMAVYTWAWLPFVIFVIVTGFVVVNLIIAVICDAISALHDDEKAKLHGTFDDEETDEEDESRHPALKEDVLGQLDALENHVEDLTRMQEETMMTLQTLALHIQEQHRTNQQQRQEFVAADQ